MAPVPEARIEYCGACNHIAILGDRPAGPFDRGRYPIVAGALDFEATLHKDDALSVELEGFAGATGCLTDLDGDGQSDPVPDGVIFQDGFESGDTSAWDAVAPLTQP